MVLQDNTEMVLQDNTEIVLQDNTEMVLQDNTELFLKDDTEMVLQDNTEMVLQDDTGMVLQDNTEMVLQDGSSTRTYLQHTPGPFKMEPLEEWSYKMTHKQELLFRLYDWLQLLTHESEIQKHAKILQTINSLVFLTTFEWLTKQPL